MAREADDKISGILEQFGIPIGGNVWRVQGTPVIYHRTLEEIAAQLGILCQAPTIIRSERDECVMIVQGSMLARDDKGKPTDKTLHEWSIGEAVINVNYRVSGKQAAYVYAMAEKRAKDRVILKLIGLSGHLCSEAEADDFKHGAKTAGQADSKARGSDNPAEIEADLRKQIEAQTTWQAVRDLMLDDKTQDALAYLAPGIHDDVRAFATVRLKALGWAPKQATGRAGQGAGRGGDRIQR